ncbi:unnamed protein product [Effrenium voratum]|nr:unnamed protein product [Effrenium voratum]
MANLLERYNQVSQSPHPEEDIRGRAMIKKAETMPLKELAQHQIRFGKVKKGHTYGQAFLDPAYVKWFLERLAKSDRPEHQEFRIFIRRQTEALEESRGPTLPTSSKSANRSQQMLLEIKKEPSDSEEECKSEPPEKPDPLTMIEGLNLRLVNLELAIQQIVGHIQQVSQTET